MASERLIQDEIDSHLDKISYAEELARTDNLAGVIKILNEFRDERFRELFALPSLQSQPDTQAQETIEQQMAMTRLIKEGKLTLKQLRELRYGFGLLSDSEPSIVTFNVDADFDRSIKEMIDDCNFDCVFGGMTPEKFPVSDHTSGNIDLYLFTFRHIVPENDFFDKSDYEFDSHYEFVLDRLEKNGCRPADLAELLALAQKYPDLQRKNRICALGSLYRDVWKGKKYASCPMIAEFDFEEEDGLGPESRILLPTTTSDLDFDSYNFLAVRK